MLLIVCLCLVAAFVAASWWALASKRIKVANWAGCAVIFVWLVGSGVNVYFDRVAASDGVEQLLASMESASWSMPAAQLGEVDRAGTNVAPVSNLIEGLEARLASEPDDAKGWALLAQSYSFVGNTESAERATVRAVELGFAESELRSRVNVARREAHPPLSNSADIDG